jgi:hypothetical protein
MDAAAIYLRDIIDTFGRYRRLGDAGLAQVSDADLLVQIDDEANSLAMIVHHIAGNLRSRFTDFLTSDGEKPDRNRDQEFDAVRPTRAEMLAQWDAAWTILTEALEALTPADVTRTVYIRGEAFAVVEALNRSVTHLAYHVGQMVLLAKHFAGPRWTSLSIPKGQSQAYRVGTFKQDIIPDPKPNAPRRR